MKKTTFNLLEPIVEAISKEFHASSIIENSPGNYTLESSNTLWLTQGFTISIDGVDYLITAIIANESITITGASLPVLDTFDIYPPFFIHGTILATNKELSAETNGFNKYPLIWLHEVTDEKFNKEPDALIERESDCEIYFLVSSSLEGWLTINHDNEAVIPMRNLRDAFIAALEASNAIGVLEGFRSMDHANFGVYSASKGHTPGIFNDNTSGTQLKITIPFIKQDDCCDDCETNSFPDSVTLRNTGNTYNTIVTPADSPVILADTVVTQSDGSPELVPYGEPVICQAVPTCEPVSIIDQNETEIDSIAAGGTYQVEVLIEITDTINSNTATITDPII